MIGFLENQVQNAQEIRSEKSQSEKSQSEQAQSEVEKSLARLGGAVDFEASFSLDAKQPDLLEKWSGEGRIWNSTISAAPHRLESVSAALSLLAGKLTVTDLGGRFPAGGRLSGKGRIGVTDGKLESAEITAADMPLSWLARVGAQVDAGIAKFLQRVRIEPDEDDNQLEGTLSAQFLLQDNGVAGPPLDGQNPN